MDIGESLRLMRLSENLPFVAVLIEFAKDAPEGTPCFFVPSESSECIYSAAEKQHRNSARANEIRIPRKMAAGVARRYKPEKDGYVFGSARSCDTFHTLVSKQQWIRASGICKSQIRRFEALSGCLSLMHF